MNTPQSGILEQVPKHARYLEFRMKPDAKLTDVLSHLSTSDIGGFCIVGFGVGLIDALNCKIEALRAFPDLTNAKCSVPSTQADIWCAVRADEPGDVVHKSRVIEAALAPAFDCTQRIDGFKYKEGRDLTGYVDGTENPEGDDATDVAIVSSSNSHLTGSSFVAVQKWVHNLDHFEGLDPLHRDHIIGRRLSDNEELDDAPASAHVKRTAQESFEPEAFVVRRSLPWSNTNGSGLMFVAYGKSLDAFEVQMKRMIGDEDGIVDGLFEFSQPLTGGYYWCPPANKGKLNLAALGL